jgi:hypothetical protein
MNNELKTLTDMYVEAFDCSSKAMKEYLDKRILIIGDSIVEQDKVAHLYEIRDYPVDGFMVAEGKEYSINHNRFPYGIYVGSRIKNTVNNEIGYVVGINNEFVQVAFENGVKPLIVSAGKDFFDKGYFVVE